MTPDHALVIDDASGIGLAIAKAACEMSETVPCDVGEAEGVTMAIVAAAARGPVSTRVGLADADIGARAILPRIIIGQGRATDFLYTARSMLADKGECWGFHNRMVDAGSLPTEAGATCVQTQDFVRAYNALVAKQKPGFEGN